MNYDQLYNEISQLAYVGMTDAEIVVALNARTPVRRRVSIADLQARAMETGVYTALRVAVATPGTPEQLRAVCQTVLDLANARFADVDLDNAASQQMFGALRQAGVITAEQAAMIDALADAPGASRAGALGLGVVVENDIMAARDWQAAQVAEAARLAAFAALRERLIGGYGAALAWLQAQVDGGMDAPEWASVVERM